MLAFARHLSPDVLKVKVPRSALLPFFGGRVLLLK